MGLASEIRMAFPATLAAVAAGLALLVTRITGTEELVDDGVNGFFCERDGAAIAARPRALGDDRGLLAALGAAARRSAEAYDWERVVDSYEQLYLQLAEAPGAA
jgi:glycosyltransferase involved in cell wall biosynthesis